MISSKNDSPASSTRETRPLCDLLSFERVMWGVALGAAFFVILFVMPRIPAARLAGRPTLTASLLVGIGIAILITLTGLKVNLIRPADPDAFMRKYKAIFNLWGWLYVAFLLTGGITQPLWQHRDPLPTVFLWIGLSGFPTLFVFKMVQVLAGNPKG